MGVGRVEDAVALATYFAPDMKNEGREARDNFQKILGKASYKLNPGQRTRLTWDEKAVCCMLDDQGVLLYCVVCYSSSYPEKSANELLKEFLEETEKLDMFASAKENELNKELKPTMQRLIQKYESPDDVPLLESLIPKKSGMRTRNKIATVTCIALVCLLVVVGAGVGQYAIRWGDDGQQPNSTSVGDDGDNATLEEDEHTLARLAYGLDDVSTVSQGEVYYEASGVNSIRRLRGEHIQDGEAERKADWMVLHFLHL